MSLPFLIAYALLIPHSRGSAVVSLPTSITANGTIIALSTTAPETACDSIRTCRTLYNIVWSSLVTILACVWTAVHRNVPGPARPLESRLRHVVARVLEVVKIVMVTLLVPEWVLASAVRQFLNACALGRELEGARVEAERSWTAKGRESSDVGDAEEGEEEESRENGDPWYSEETDEEHIPTEDRHAGRSPFARSESTYTPERSSPRRLYFLRRLGTVAIHDGAGRLSSKWTTRHGFFIIMGGFHYYKDGKPIHPLSRFDVIELVRTGDLVPPTEEEIGVLSQGDVLSKGLAIFQTLWFLEVMTLAYTTITIAMYVAWWDKPQNVSGPVRVVVEHLPEDMPSLHARFGRAGYFVYVIAGMQDPLYSGSYDANYGLYADAVTLAVAVVFGAVHCAAWNYTFPSRAAKVLWRLSSVAVAGLPGLMLVPNLAWLFRLNFYSVYKIGIVDDVFQVMIVAVFLLSGPVYVAARVLLLALSFTTLGLLPAEAYQTVQWTLLIYHFT
ncbi:hypothetical protein BV25DRAFT_1840377 [Artomyces pyxidatus]|uniref:Uncharacterized protein n=1 Tax=Artomyces pyxidatus TaxID=48021 RepID=A0ACB8STP5_9AGAM|nr:hypothetical protein BV25DRAFT_1840377 [Artomyces pyxidatus]